MANAYEMLGLVKEKEKVLAKYSHLFTEEGPTKTHRRKSFESKKHMHLTSEKPRQGQLLTSSEEK